MKQTISTLAIVGTIVTILAFTHADNKSEGAIGDVKYSVLPPDKFREENGSGWFLMDNKVPIVGSDLDNKHGIKEIPDARGLFIRSLNGTRADERSDVFEADSGRARLLGDYQADAIKRHKHNLSVEMQYFGGWNGNNIWSGTTPGHPITVGNSNNTPISVLDVGENLIANETRPKNIALYTYIKINE